MVWFIIGMAFIGRAEQGAGEMLEGAHNQLFMGTTFTGLHVRHSPQQLSSSHSIKARGNKVL